MSQDLFEADTEERYSRMAPLERPEAGAWDGFGRGTGLGTMRLIATAARSAYMMSAPLMVANDAIGDGTRTQDRFFKLHDDVFQRAVDYWTPNPGEVGEAGQIAGTLLATFPLLFASPVGLITTTQMTMVQDLVEKGVPMEKAQAVGAVYGAGLGLGIKVPILGQNLWQRTLLGGAGFNVSQGVAMRGIADEIVKGTPAAGMFQPLGAVDLTLDVLLGLAFGGYAHVNPAMRAQGKEFWDRVQAWRENITPDQMAALAALRAAQHVTADSLAGQPASPESVGRHVEAIRASIEALATDRPVDVTNRPLPEVTPDEPRMAEQRAQAEELQRTATETRKEEGLAPPPDISPSRLPDLTQLAGEEQPAAIGRAVRQALERMAIPTEEAQVNGALWEAVARSLSNEFGVPAARILAKYGVDIRRLGELEEPPGALAQRRALPPREAMPNYVKRAVDSATVDPEDQMHRGATAGRQGNELIAYHVTDDPANIRQSLREGLDLTEGRGTDKFGDLGRGFYVSGIPHFWAGRSVDKWDFLPRLTPEERGRIADRLMADKHVTGEHTGYWTADERERVVTWIQRFREGRNEVATQLANQPYNLNISRADFLRPLGIEPGTPPTSVEVRLNGRFAELERAISDAEAQHLREIGFDGAFTRMGMGTNAEMVVWNRDAVRIAGERRTYFQPLMKALGMARGQWYRSELLERAQDIKQASASPEQWKGILKNLKGVKLDELRWSGVEDWLEIQAGRQRARTWAEARFEPVTKDDLYGYVVDKDGNKVSGYILGEYAQEMIAEAKQDIEKPVRITKDQVLDYLRGNIVRVDEVLGGPQEKAPTLEDAGIAGAHRVLEQGGWRVEENPEDPQQIAFVDPETGDFLTSSDMRRFMEGEPGTEMAPADRPISPNVVQAAQAIEIHWRNRGGGALHHPTWVEPGGANYRELRITLAGADRPVSPTAFTSGHFPELDIVVFVRFNERIDAEGKRVLFVEEMQSDWGERGRKAGFARRPEDQEKLEATRDEAMRRSNKLRPAANEAINRNDRLGFDTTTDALSAILEHPDWETRWQMPPGDLAPVREWLQAEEAARIAREAMQAGGHLGDIVSGPFVSARRFGVHLPGTEEINGQRVPKELKNTKGQVRRFGTMEEAEDAAKKAGEGATAVDLGMVPDEAWVALGMKRMIHWAAQNGFDKVSWTTGAQQVERYTTALRKRVDSIEWKKTESGIHLVGYKGKGSGQLSARENELLRREARNQNTPTETRELAILNRERHQARNKVVDTTQREDELSDAIGKAMADQIVNDPAQSGLIEGKDIRIDDTGMAGFYDRMLRAISNKVLEDIGGGKVGTTDILMESKTEQPLRDVRPVGREVEFDEMSDMQRQAFQGAEDFPMGDPPVMGNATLRMPDGTRLEVLVVLDHNGVNIVSDEAEFTIGRQYPRRMTQDEAINWLDRQWPQETFWQGMDLLNGELPGTGTPIKSSQHAFDITPAMREQAKRGMPLWQGGRGLIQFGEGQTLIGLFENADRSTFLHETGHFFLQVMRDFASRPGAPKRSVEHWARIANWLKIEGGDLTSAHHEQWANGWEHYFATGKAPSPELGTIFERFKQWLLEIYHSLTDMPVQFSDDVRQLMDELLTGPAVPAGQTRPAGSPPPPRGREQPAGPSATEGISQLLREIKELGGIDKSELEEITGEKAFGKMKGLPWGVFRTPERNRAGTIDRGQGLDGMARMLRDSGWDIPEFDEVGSLRDMIRAEIEGARATRLGEEGEVMTAARAMRDMDEIAANYAQAEADAAERFNFNDQDPRYQAEIARIRAERDEAMTELMKEGEDPVVMEAARTAREKPNLKIQTGTDAEGRPVTSSLRDYLGEISRATAQANQDAELMQVAATCLGGA